MILDADDSAALKAPLPDGIPVVWKDTTEGFSIDLQQQKASHTYTTVSRSFITASFSPFISILFIRKEQ